MHFNSSFISLFTSMMASIKRVWSLDEIFKARKDGKVKRSNLQAQIIDSELTAKLLGRGVAVSPVVTVEPRRRKFHKAITLSMPAPRPHTQGMTNQYSTSSAPTLRLLCSISGTLMLFCLISLPIGYWKQSYNQLAKKWKLLCKGISNYRSMTILK